VLRQRIKGLLCLVRDPQASEIFFLLQFYLFSSIFNKPPRLAIQLQNGLNRCRRHSDSKGGEARRSIKLDFAQTDLLTTHQVENGMKELAAAVEEHEPGALSYAYFLNEESKKIIVLEK
jgi:hypothetical protein